jgi:hypothetical protein
VVVRAPGRLTQRNLHADDCLVPVMPLLCFVVGADNGSLLVQDTLLGDASCTHIDQSAAADWLLKVGARRAGSGAAAWQHAAWQGGAAAGCPAPNPRPGCPARRTALGQREAALCSSPSADAPPPPPTQNIRALHQSACWATWRTSWQKVDERSVLIADTGEISGLPHGVRWRVANTTLRCTANETHPLPPGAAAPPAGAATHPSDMQLAAATSATLLATLALLYYALNRNGGRPGKRGRGLQLARGWSTGRGCCAQTPLLPPSHASPRLNLDSDSRLSHGAHPAPARPPSGVC